LAFSVPVDRSLDLRSIFKSDISNPFRPQEFERPRLPVDAGPLTGIFPEDLPSCLDMLVKMPGDVSPTLPAPYRDHAVFDSLFRSIIENETDMENPWVERYAYLTVDQRTVTPGRTHRNGGWHFDGMQGERYSVKLPCCYQYVVSDAASTEYTAHPTYADGLSETEHNWFVELGGQIPEDGEVFRFPSMTIGLMSAYQMHRSPVVTSEIRRTFVRVDVSLKQQDRLGNTPNPDLPAPFEFVERKLPPGLKTRSSTGWQGSRKFPGSASL
jgi:hypothetical protein